MKKYYIFIAAFFIFLLSACHQGVFLKTSVGRKIYVSSLHGKWVLVSYWASWCDSCKLEVPQLNKFYRTKPDDVILLGVDYVQNKGITLQKIVNKMQIEFPVIKSGLANYYNFPTITSVPTLFIVNPKKTLVATVYGVHTEAQFHQILQSVQKNTRQLSSPSGYYYLPMSTQLKRLH